jgi:hypothetical protein
MDPVLANPNASKRQARTSRGGTKPPAGSDQRISTCGICPEGVFAGDDKTWGNGIDAPIGWNHAGCVQQGRSDTRG